MPITPLQVLLGLGEQIFGGGATPPRPIPSGKFTTQHFVFSKDFHVTSFALLRRRTVGVVTVAYFSSQIWYISSESFLGSFPLVTWRSPPHNVQGYFVHKKQRRPTALQ